MAKFTDKAGREWAVELTVGDLAALRKEAGFDLSPCFTGKADLIDLIYGDHERLARALWVLCEADATRAGVTPEQFGRALPGRVLAAAGDALLEAVADFRHRPAVAAQVKAHLPTALATMEARLTKVVTDQMTSNGSAGNSPGSPAGSTPAPSPGGT